MDKKPLRVITRLAGPPRPGDPRPTRLIIELFGEIGKGAVPLDDVKAISAIQVISWFADAGAKAKLPTPSEASAGVPELVRDINLLRSSDDFVSALERSDRLQKDEDRLWHLKEAVRAIREISPHLMQSLMEQKVLTGEAAVSDFEIGPLIRLYEAANARLPLSKKRLRDAAGHTGNRRALWHDAAELVAERAKGVWSTVTDRRLGCGKSTSPIVLFTAKALVAAELGDHSAETVSKALLRRRDK